MSDIARTDDLFFARTGMDTKRVEALTDNAIGDSDDGELFLEYRQSESITFDDGRVRNASFDTSQGFGLRSVAGEATGYAHSTELSEAAIARAGETVRAVRGGASGTVANPPAGTNRDLYADINPLGSPSFEEKVQLLSDIDAYARAADPRIRQ
ncbi:MAG: metalloprotease TldD, partial [Alphaproteobacteria bacterium]|nr:metalloprotease TldD [Alphaproteobacteria bacterium]